MFDYTEEEILATKIYAPQLSRSDLLHEPARKYDILFSRINLPKDRMCLHPTDWLCLDCVALFFQPMIGGVKS